MDSLKARLRAIEKVLEAKLRPPAPTVAEVHALFEFAMHDDAAALHTLADFKARACSSASDGRPAFVR